MIPTKRILSKAHLAAFARSPAHAEILGFVDSLNDSIIGKKLTEAGEPSAVSFCFLGFWVATATLLTDEGNERNHAYPRRRAGHCKRYAARGQ